MELKKLDMDDIKRRILYGLIILSLLPLITMFYINLKQDKWETDRNFYGKEISEDQLKITQNTYQKYECSSKKITKKKELGNMRYYYRDKNHINFEANEEEYNKYIKDSDIFYVYKPKCQISYHSDNGKLTADFTGKKISFEPGTFNSAELRSITKLVHQKSRSKIFSTYSISDVNKRYLNSNNIAIIIGRSLIWKFFDSSIYNHPYNSKGAITNFRISSKSGNGTVHGKSLIKSEKYDRLYHDFVFYQMPKAKFTSVKDRWLLFSAELGVGYLHGYYIIYFIFFAILWLPICLDQFLTVDSATKNTVICFEQMFVIVAWIGPFNRIGIILSIITILCLLFFPYKRNPFYDLQKDGIDMMKKDFGSFLDK